MAGGVAAMSSPAATAAARPAPQGQGQGRGRPWGDPMAEQELLAQLLIDPSVHDQVFEALVPTDFMHPGTQQVYAQMRALWEHGQRPSQALVLARLQQQGGDPRDAQQLLAQLGVQVPVTPCDQLVRIIQDWSLRHRAVTAARSLQQLAQDPTVAIPDLVAQAQSLQQQVELPDSQGKAQPVAQMLQGQLEPSWVIPGLLEVQDRVIVVAPEGRGKALALHTPIPLARGGVSTMGQLQPGDKIVGPRGEPRLVVAKSPVLYQRDLVLLEFDNGEQVAADHDHRWRVWYRGLWHLASSWQLAEWAARTVAPTPPPIWLPSVSDPDQRGPRLQAVHPLPSEPVQCLQVDHPDGLFQVGGRGTLTHNSTLLRQFAVMAAAGLHPFSAQPLAAPLRTLIVDLENRESQVRRRLLPLVAQAAYSTGSDEWATERCFVYCRPEGLDVGDRNDLGELTATVRQVRPQLLTIGPLYKLASGDPTDEEVARAVAGVLDRLVSHFGCAMMIEAHAPHGDAKHGRREMRVYGASLWQRWPEFGLGLYPLPDGSMRVEHWRGAREERDWPSYLARGRIWPWVASQGSEPEEGL